MRPAPGQPSLLVTRLTEKDSLLCLPSGRQVRLVAARKTSILAGSAALLKAFDSGEISLLDAEDAPLPVEGLTVEDFQILRARLTSLGVLEEPEIQRPCSNCGHALVARPCALLEWGAFLDGDLDDPELDAPFPFGKTLPLAPDAGENEALKVVLRATTVGESRSILETPERLRPTAAQVKSLGIVRLGDETHAGRIARQLQRCEQEEWDALIDHLDRAWYGPRLEAWLRCPSCEARHGIWAPAVREFPEIPREERLEAAGDFPAFEAFSARVEALAKPIFARSGGRGVGLYVEGGPAACDEGGVALLGSYEPGIPEDHGVVARPPEVTLFYRTFRAMHEEDGPYDLDDEICETLEHELEHHRAFLGGYDPQDEEEREDIARELRGHLGGTEVLRRSAASARRGIWDFFYRTWPLWLIGLGVVLLEAWASAH